MKNTSYTSTDPNITHFIFTICLSFTQILALLQLLMWHILISFFISFCNIRGLSSNLNSVHQHLQFSSPHGLFLTETKIKPLDPDDNSNRSPHLKYPGYELSSSFFPNGSVCAFIRSGVQSSRLPQFDLFSPGFQLIYLKIFYLIL